MENPVAWEDMPLRDEDGYCLQLDSLVPWEAIVYIAFGQALKGDVQAMEWLRRSAYGNKVDACTPDDIPSITNAAKLVIEVKKPDVSATM